MPDHVCQIMCARSCVLGHLCVMPGCLCGTCAAVGEGVRKGAVANMAQDPMDCHALEVVEHVCDNQAGREVGCVKRTYDEGRET